MNKLTQSQLWSATPPASVEELIAHVKTVDASNNAIRKRLIEELDPSDQQHAAAALPTSRVTSWLAIADRPDIASASLPIDDTQSHTSLPGSAAASSCHHSSVTTAMHNPPIGGIQTHSASGYPSKELSLDKPAAVGFASSWDHETTSGAAFVPVTKDISAAMAYAQQTEANDRPLHTRGGRGTGMMPCGRGGTFLGRGGVSRPVSPAPAVSCH